MSLKICFNKTTVWGRLRYNGAKKYLVIHQFCKFSLKMMTEVCNDQEIPLSDF